MHLLLHKHWICTNLCAALQEGYYYQAGVFIVWGAGVVQTLIYVDFFYYYVTW